MVDMKANDEEYERKAKGHCIAPQRYTLKVLLAGVTVEDIRSVTEEFVGAREGSPAGKEWI
jgi:hypothetical protein